MNLRESVTTVLRKYAEFRGTATRPEFWWFALFSSIVHAALNALNVAVADGTVYLGASLSGAFGIVVLVPTLAVSVRRLRDTDRTWVNLFWLLLPVAGLIVLVVQLADTTHRPVQATDSAAPAPATSL